MVEVPEEKVKPVIVEEGVRNSEDEARPPEKTENTGLVAPTTFNKDPASAVLVPIVILELERRNTVEELRWRFTKSPRKVDDPTFAPRRVPEVWPPRIGWAESWIMERVVVAKGDPVKAMAGVPETPEYEERSCPPVIWR